MKYSRIITLGFFLLAALAFNPMTGVKNLPSSPLTLTDSQEDYEKPPGKPTT
jgi:hypothetical protein